jgi:hypothetical protein
MARWSEVEQAAPELAQRAQAMFDANRHKTMATVRADGAPRISGTELERVLGDLWLGSMPGAVKARDLQRDPRVAIHSASPDPGPEGNDWPGDAKLAGIAEAVTDAAELARWAAARGDGAAEEPPTPESFHLFRIDVRELVVTALNDEHTLLVVTWWTEAEGLRSVERE